MNERSSVVAGAILGALVGTAVGYLFFTKSGRALRDRLEPSMDDLRREFGRFQRTLDRMGEAASDGLGVVQERQRSASTPEARRGPRPLQ